MLRNARAGRQRQVALVALHVTVCSVMPELQGRDRWHWWHSIFWRSWWTPGKWETNHVSTNKADASWEVTLRLTFGLHTDMHVYPDTCVHVHTPQGETETEMERQRETSRHFHHHRSSLLLILTSLSKFLQLSLRLTSDDLCVTLGQVGRAEKTLIGFRSAPGSGFTWRTVHAGSALHPTLPRVAMCCF